MMFRISRFHFLSVALWGLHLVASLLVSNDTFAQSVPACSNSHNAGLCIGMLYIDQPVSLAPNESFSCSLDFSHCGTIGARINNWWLQMIRTDEAGNLTNKPYDASKYTFQLVDALTSTPVNLAELRGWYFENSILSKNDGVYIGASIPATSRWILNVTRAPERSAKSRQSFAIISNGAISK